MSNYWVSWYRSDKSMQEFEYHGPWWCTGYRDNDGIYCAAVNAGTTDEAKKVISESFDNHPGNIKWRFIEKRDNDWSPFSDRFPRADWMQWPVKTNKEN